MLTRAEKMSYNTMLENNSLTQNADWQWGIWKQWRQWKVFYLQLYSSTFPNLNISRSFPLQPYSIQGKPDWFILSRLLVSVSLVWYSKKQTSKQNAVWCLTRLYFRPAIVLLWTRVLCKYYVVNHFCAITFVYIDPIYNKLYLSLLL